MCVCVVFPSTHATTSTYSAQVYAQTELRIMLLQSHIQINKNLKVPINWSCTAAIKLFRLVNAWLGLNLIFSNFVCK